MRRVALAASSLLLLLVLLVAAVLGGGSCGSGAGGDVGSLSSKAQAQIPTNIARIYVQMAKRWDIDVAFLASIGAQETDHGRNANTHQVNGSGCAGVMQLGTGGSCGDFFGENKCDGDGDGREDVMNDADNICAAAKGLRQAKGAPPAGGSYEGYYRAACGYYGACGDVNANYAPEVMARAVAYGFKGGTKTSDTQFVSDNAGADSTGTAAGCSAADFSNGTITGNGRVVVDPGANRPGTTFNPSILRYISAVSARLPRPLIVTTGTNHSQFSSSGLQSDHWTGDAVDLGSVRNNFPIGGGYGNTIATQALIVAGMPPAQAKRVAEIGGGHTLVFDGLRIQVIWRTGGHLDHVHLGARPATSGDAPGDFQL